MVFPIEVHLISSISHTSLRLQPHWAILFIPPAFVAECWLERQREPRRFKFGRPSPWGNKKRVYALPRDYFGQNSDNRENYQESLMTTPQGAHGKYFSLATFTSDGFGRTIPRRTPHTALSNSPTYWHDTPSNGSGMQWRRSSFSTSSTRTMNRKILL